MIEKKKALFIRLDKIGDLICTLPADQVLDSLHYEVTWVVQKGLGSVVDLGSRTRNYIEIDIEDAKSSIQILRLLIKNLKPDVAISFQGPWWINFELLKSGIPIRGGVKSQWHSFLFLNKALRQKRSQAEKHELEYNLDLVYHTLDIRPSKLFHFFEIHKPQSFDTLAKFELEPQKYVVIHPGMNGSALNWPQKNYIKKIYSILESEMNVVITGTESDEPYLNDIKKEFTNNENTEGRVKILQSQLSLSELVEVLSHSIYVIAPSTGVAHIAASLRLPIKAIYSPVQVHHAKRWGPRGTHVEVFLPEVKCPGVFSCEGTKCPQFNCMNTLAVH